MAANLRLDSRDVERWERGKEQYEAQLVSNQCA